MDTPFAQCDHWLQLSDREQQILTRVPVPHHFTPVEEVSCSLQHGHAGRHLALGQSGGTPESGHYTAYWLHWTATTQGLVFVNGLDRACDVQGRSWREPETIDLVGCLLPDGHDGAHDWQIEWFYRELTPQMEEWVAAFEAEHS